MARDHERYVEDLAPYLLGALSALEAEALEKHLRECAECQREVGELRTGADALARSVPQLEPPASLRERLLGELSGEAEGSPASDPSSAPAPATAPGEGAGADATRRRAGRRGLARLVPRRPPTGSLRWGRPALALPATALVALAAGAAGWLLGGAGTEEARTVAATVDRGRLPNASARLTVPDDGQDPVLHLDGLRNLGPQRTYEIWVQRDGELAPGPLFSPTADGAAVTGIPGEAEDIEAVFVTRERAGGARTPTETPVVSVPLRS